ncbi:MAG TPA: aldo/keto reductase [Bryobacteraceae bacterium]|nr:aldo/keto reductase [Bryobacteraceae bacterium]
MQHIALRHTDLTVSRVCLGTMTFGGQTDIDEAARLVDHCLDSGVNFFDTANIYNKGASETILGRILRGRRSGVVLASKVRGKMGDGPNESGLSRVAIMRALDDTLRRLGTDYLDLYYLHQPDYDVPLEESLDAIDRLVRLGKVRWPASSNYASWQVCRMLWLAETHSYKPACVTQPMYNVLARGIEQEYLPMAKEFGVSTVVYNPLAGGLLTGKQQREAPIPGTRFDNNQLYLDRYWHPAYFDAVDRLGAIAASVGRSLVSLALNWLLHHSPADCLILGASRLDQISENLRAAEEGPLPEDAVAACDQVWADLRGITPKYNR